MEAAPLSDQSTDSGAGVLIFSHPHNQFITPVDAGLVKDIRHMLFDCGLRDEKRFCDHGIGFSLYDELRDFRLAPGQRIRHSKFMDVKLFGSRDLPCGSARFKDRGFCLRSRLRSRFV